MDVDKDMAAPSPSTAATEAEWRVAAHADLRAVSESGEDEVEVDAVLARMDQLMHLVSVATSEEDKQSRQRFSRLCKRSMDKLWNDLPQGIVRQLSMMETAEEGSGSEIWEPPNALKAAKPNSQGEELVKLARLVFLQSMQLEVKGQRAFAAELQCKAMKDRALNAESYLSSLENELQIHKELVDELRVERRNLVIENAMLGARRLETLPDKPQPKPKDMSAEKLHRDASELLEKLSRAGPSQPRQGTVAAAPSTQEPGAPQMNFGQPSRGQMVQVPSTPSVPSGAFPNRRHTLSAGTKAAGSWSVPEPRFSSCVWAPEPRCTFGSSGRLAPMTWPSFPMSGASRTSPRVWVPRTCPRAAWGSQDPPSF